LGVRPAARLQALAVEAVHGKCGALAGNEGVLDTAMAAQTVTKATRGSDR